MKQKGYDTGVALDDKKRIYIYIYIFSFEKREKQQQRE